MKKQILLGALIAALVGVGSWNYIAAHRPIARRLAVDPRNQKVNIWAYHRYGLAPGTLVIDLRAFSDEAAMLDVMRALLQGAEALKSREFERVLLAYKGKPKFMLTGSYYQKLGQEFEGQNPIYTLRTFPENVYKLDGSPAYGTWTGGLIGVLGKQMEDLNQFSKDWYLDDAIKGMSAKQ